jgi:hypothetical protein
MIAMCDRCHSTVTQLFDRQDIPKTEEKLKWIAKKREETENSIRAKVVPWYRKVNDANYDENSGIYFPLDDSDIDTL